MLNKPEGKWLNWARDSPGLIEDNSVYCIPVLAAYQCFSICKMYLPLVYLRESLTCDTFRFVLWVDRSFHDIGYFSLQVGAYLLPSMCSWLFL